MWNASGKLFRYLKRIRKIVSLFEMHQENCFAIWNASGKLLRSLKHIRKIASLLETYQEICFVIWNASGNLLCYSKRIRKIALIFETHQQTYFVILNVSGKLFVIWNASGNLLHYDFENIDVFVSNSSRNNICNYLLTNENIYPWIRTLSYRIVCIKLISSVKKGIFFINKWIEYYDQTFRSDRMSTSLFLK